MARVLVVDDSSIMRRNLISILTKAGHTIVSEAANGEQAYREYEKHQPDLVTMDITMPVMDGIGAVKKIVGSYPNANIIMISALDQKFMVLTAIQNGAKHYIIKPFSSDKVTAVVNEVLKSAAKAEKDGNTENTAKKPAAANNSVGLDNTIDNLKNSIENINSAIEKLDTEEDSGDAVEEEEVEEENPLPFSIENKNNALIININKTICLENFQSLSMVIQGFLFVKPLKVILNFGSISSLEDSMLDKVAELIKPVRDNNGDVKVVSKSRDFIQQVRLKRINAMTVCYKNFSEIEI